MWGIWLAQPPRCQRAPLLQCLMLQLQTLPRWVIFPTDPIDPTDLHIHTSTHPHIYTSTHP